MGHENSCKIEISSSYSYIRYKERLEVRLQWQNCRMLNFMLYHILLVNLTDIPWSWWARVAVSIWGLQCLCVCLWPDRIREDPHHDGNAGTTHYSLVYRSSLPAIPAWGHRLGTPTDKQALLPFNLQNLILILISLWSLHYSICNVAKSTV